MVAEIGRVGLWRASWEWDVPEEEFAATIGELDQLGYGAIWYGGAPGDLKLAERILANSTRLAAATGIVNIWAGPAEPVAQAYQRVAAAYPGRFVLGVGIGHPEHSAAQGYAKPYQALVNYLDELTSGEHAVPAAEIVVAALGPKVAALSATRTGGAHPYLTTPEHTRRTREIIGADALLAPEQKVVLSTDPTQARAIARQGVAMYLGLSNYLRNLRTLGFTDEDFADGGSDRLVDELVAWGDPETVAGRITAHHDAGADHVTVQVLSDQPGLPREDWRTLASALSLS